LGVSSLFPSLWDLWRSKIRGLLAAPSGTVDASTFAKNEEPYHGASHQSIFVDFIMLDSRLSKECRYGLIVTPCSIGKNQQAMSGHYRPAYGRSEKSLHNPLCSNKSCAYNELRYSGWLSSIR
jgi:hypothetical protein